MAAAMRQRASLEIRVGLFVIAGLALLVFFLFTIGDFDTYFQPGYDLRVVFDSANGVGRGSPVQYAGVEVGKIQDLQLVYGEGQAPHVEVAIRVPTRIIIRADDAASISTFGLLGEKYVEIVPGSGAGAALKPGEVLLGKPAVSTERIMERSNEVLSELKRTLEGLNSLVGDPEARLYLAETLQEARDATRNWKLVAERMNITLSRLEAANGSIGKLLYDDQLYREILFFVQDLREHPWKLLSRPKDNKK